MRELETFIEKDYRYHAAGKVWVVTEIQWTRLPDGAVGLDQDESHRIHKAIANALCGSSRPLTFEEFEFLADVTGVSFTEVATHLDIHKSTISRWRRVDGPFSRLYSLALKRLFWFKLFARPLLHEKVTLEQVQDERELLHLASQRAIDCGLADSIHALEAA